MTGGAGQRTRAGRLGLALAGLLLAFGLGEGSLLLLDERRDDPGVRFVPVTASTREAVGRFEPDRTRFFTLAPDTRAGPDHAGRYASDGWPYRGEPAEPRPPGTVVVAILGDSCSYGFGVDTAQALPERLRQGLVHRGVPADRLLVLDFGVPGYSTVQINAQLDEVLERHRPDAVVVYPAAWNDQAPALWKDDLTLRERAQHPTLSQRLRGASHLLRRLLPGDDVPLPEAEVLAAWREGRPPYGERVPEAALQEELDAFAARCASAAVPVVVVSAPHPPKTRADHPRCASDAARVESWARQRGFGLVAGQSLLAADAGGDGAEQLAPYFVDYVHPSPPALALLGDAAAEALRPELDPRLLAAQAESRAPLRIVSVEPHQLPSLGDVTVRVTLEGWDGGHPVPAVSLGGAPLLDLRVVGHGVLEGLAMANAEGRQDVIVRTARSMAVLPHGVVIDAPRLEAQLGEAPVLRLFGRPGDRARVLMAGQALERPVWSPRGACWLPEEGRFDLGDLVLGPEGVGEITFPYVGPQPSPRVVMQALVAPPGDDALAETAGRWSPLLRMDG